MRQEVYSPLEPSCYPKYAGMSYPAKTPPVPASAGCVPPVPLPQPIEGPYGIGGCPKPAHAPYATWPAWPVYKGRSTAGTILVLFILLVIISRGFPLAGAKICRK